MFRVVLLCLCAHAAATPRRVKRDVCQNVPEACVDVPALVKKNGYPIETETVINSAGFHLTMHRIPHGRDNNNNKSIDRPVVFLMHGLLSSSADWVLMGPGEKHENNGQEKKNQNGIGLGYILAEAGYDVWLGNARGNYYSRHNDSAGASEKNSIFWKFSWDEIGLIDIPLMIDHALRKTRKEKLHYIGFSQGTTAFFVMCALDPAYNEKIISMHALAPVVYLPKTRSYMEQLATVFTSFIVSLLEEYSTGEVFPRSRNWDNIAEACRYIMPAAAAVIFKGSCEDLMYLIGGWNKAQISTAMLPLVLGHVPAGASIRQFAHYAQLMSSQKFQRYDHGTVKNIDLYGTPDPPIIDLKKVTVPVYLHFSSGDERTTKRGVRRLKRELGNGTISTKLKYFSHLDFVWAKDAKKLVYDKVIEIMREDRDVYANTTSQSDRFQQSRLR